MSTGWTECRLCGAPISSRESMATGFGAECRAVVAEVDRKAYFSDPEFRQLYYNAGIDKLIALLEEYWLEKKDRMRSQFKLQFIPSAIEFYREKGFLSQKQKDIVKDIVLSADMFINGRVVDIYYLDDIEKRARENVRSEWAKDHPIAFEEYVKARKAIRSRYE